MGLLAGWPSSVTREMCVQAAGQHYAAGPRGLSIQQHSAVVHMGTATQASTSKGRRHPVQQRLSPYNITQQLTGGSASCLTEATGGHSCVSGALSRCDAVSAAVLGGSVAGSICSGNGNCAWAASCSEIVTLLVGLLGCLRLRLEKADPSSGS